MLILIADDNQTNRNVLRNTLASEGHTIIEANDGDEALRVLQAANEPVVALVDWEMPKMEGVEVCRQIRLRQGAPPMFLLLVTIRDQTSDIVTGLQSGANDYVTKPFHRGELLARVRLGVEMVTLQQNLLSKIAELNKALSEVKQLQALLPICCYCKKVRDDGDYWQAIEEYIARHSNTQFSHGICPECYEVHVKPQFKPGGSRPY